MTLASGARLGSYEIISPLGAGGMGEVYRATDSNLKRSVAIKVLPASMASDADRLARFQREAEVLAALNHPNIAQIFGLEKTPELTALVMELVEGEDLSHRIARGAIPIDEALPIAKQIAEALEAAHEQGIIHRDLKPANIKVRPDGTVKVLDFGLAKALDELKGSSPQAIEDSPTVTSPAMTMQGVILGTAAYMSPEQAKGRAVDKRSDIWAFGVVLYEMLSGRRAFAGEHVSDVLVAVLSQDVDLAGLPAGTSSSIRALIRRCLTRDPKQRLRDIGEARVTIAGIERGDAEIESGIIENAAARRGGWRDRRTWLAMAAVVVAIAASGVAGTIVWRGASGPLPAMYFSAPFPTEAHDLAVAPNGHTVAIVGDEASGRKTVIWLYDVGGQTASPLAGSEGASFPFWSPDGRAIGFFADGKLKRLELDGGRLQTLCDAPSGRGGTWNKDGTILFTASGELSEGLSRISAAGGAAVRVSTPDKQLGLSSERWPMFLPDGKHYLFLSDNFNADAGAGGPGGLYMGVLDSDEKRLVVKTSANAAYAAPGYLLFVQEGTLFAQSFNWERAELSGEPVGIVSQIEYSPKIERAVFAVSDTGALFVQKSSAAALSRLLWFDRQGNELSAVGAASTFANVMLSPAAQSVAVEKTDEGRRNTDVWTYDLERDRARRLTFDSALDALPIWSPDGRQLIFTSSRRLGFGLYLKNVDGAQEEKAIDPGDADSLPNSWSRDGKYVLYSRGQELWTLVFPELKTRPFLKAPFTVKNGQFSPDGKWVSYSSNESGTWEIYVTSFPDGRGKWQVSAGGGDQSRWNSNGTELFYLSPDRKMIAVPITTSGSVDAGAQTVLFQANPREPTATSEQYVYDVDPGGQRFLINTQVKKSQLQPVSVLLNWDRVLKK